MTHAEKKEPALYHQDRPTTNHTLSLDLSALDRRRKAAHRCQPLECGCRDSWTCRCHDNPELTDRQIEAAIDAAEHLLSHQLTPQFTIPTRRALWRAGRRDLATLTEVIA